MPETEDDDMLITRTCEACGEEFSTEDPEQMVCDECWDGFEEDIEEEA